MLKLPANLIALDTETTGLNPWPTERRRAAELGPDTPFAISTCNLKMETNFLRGKVDPFTRRVSWSEKVLAPVKELCEDPYQEIAFHNAPFDIGMLKRIGVRVRAKVWDTLIMAHTCDPSLQAFNLKFLGEKLLEISKEDESDLVEDVRARRRLAAKLGWKVATKETHHKDPLRADYWIAHPPLLEKYARQDAARTMMLTILFADLLNENASEGGKLLEIYENEMRLMPVMRRMRRYGMTYLPENAKGLQEFYADFADNQGSTIKLLGYPELNCRSHKQLKQVFIEKKGYSTTTITGNGDYKIDAEQLMVWARGSAYGTDSEGDAEDGDRLARAIIELKTAQKALEFLESWDYFRGVRADGSSVLRPFYRQVGPVTGRMSCSDPNLQQVPMARSGRRYSYAEFRQREAFGPRPGHVWYLPDYSQVEVWLLAFQAQEPSMTEALLNGFDLHMATATRAWGKRRDFEEKKKAWRVRAKMITFAKLYGGGLDKIQLLLRCSKADAASFISDFEAQLPEMQRFVKRLINKVRREGKLVNLFGREYPIDPNFAYKAVNYLIQGSAADLIKRAMIRIDKIHPQVRFMGQLHDELFIELPKKLHCKSLMREIQSAAQEDSALCGIPKPLPIGFKVTWTNWSETKEVEP